MPHSTSSAPKPLRAAAVVLAGGSGTRVGADRNKVFLPLAGRSIASWALNTFVSLADFEPVVFVVRPEDMADARAAIQREVQAPVEVNTGGATRQDSELNALRHLAPRIDSGAIDVVLIHDAARPLASAGLLASVAHAARTHGGAIPAIPAPDAVHVGEKGLDLSERTLLKAQTPQGFVAKPLLDAYEQAARDKFVGTDTASCMEKYTDIQVHWVMGEETNFKVTYAQDLMLAQEVVNALGLRHRKRSW